MGVSYKRFSGWVPEAVTVYEHDEAGVLVRSATTAESEWDEQERAWFLALAQYESELCPLCGRPLSVCTSPEAELRTDVPLPTRCHFTTAVQQARTAYESTANPQALMFTASVRRA